MTTRGSSVPSQIAPAVVLAEAVVAISLLGCGVQGPPQPPRIEVPGRVEDLKIEQVGRKLEVQFTLPQLAVDGQRLTKPLEIEILRAQATPGSPPPKSPPSAVWVWLQPARWAAYASERRIAYPAALSENEFKNWQATDSILAIRTLTRGFRGRPVLSEISNLVRLRVLEVSRPVDRIKSTPAEKAIELAWQAPAKTLEGAEVQSLAGYRIYRSTTGKPGSFQLTGESKAPSYQDGNFEFGHAYSYQIAAVFKQGETTAESEPSQPYEVIPRDVFPPATPTGLTAFYTNGAMELVWNANSEKDLAGYYVYRHERGGNPRRLNQELLRSPILRDTSVEAGHTYFYQVTAVDLSNNQSQPSQEVEGDAQN